MNESRLSIALREFIATLRPMSWRDRIDHIWTYYKEIILIGAVVIILLASIVGNALKPRLEVRMSGYLANITLSEDGSAYLKEDYLSHLGGSADSQTVILNSTVFGGEGYLTSMEANYNAALAPVLQVTAQEVDYMLLDEVALEFYLNKAFFMDLRQLLNEEELKQLELTYYQPVDIDEKPVGGSYPVAVDITGTAFAQGCAKDAKKVYFVAVANGPNKDDIRNFWEYLNSWKEAE